MILLCPPYMVEMTKIGRNVVLKLMEAVGEYISDTVRQLDKRFLMPIEDIQSQGTAATGHVEQGTIKGGEEVEVLSLMQGGALKTTATSIEMFKKILVQGQVGMVREKIDIDLISIGDNLYDNGLTGDHKTAFEESFTNIYTAKSLLK